MKTAVFIIAEKIFHDEEYQVPKNILTKAGIKVVTASTTTGEATGKFGMKVKPDILISRVKLDEIDALVYIGGGGCTQYFNDLVAHRLAQEGVKKGILVAAICSAPSILANAGVLKGKKATVFSGDAEYLNKGDAIYTKATVEVDGKILTGCGPEAAQKFGEEIVMMLGL